MPTPPRPTPDVETVVVGAGVVGLATTEALLAAGHEVMLLERHGGIGQETSSRSSEVIHAGLYYPPGSLKAKLCVDGRERLYAFARENAVPHARYGKLVVATSDDEIAALGRLEQRARTNGVTDVERFDTHEVRAREPEVSAVAALWSPSTGVIDSHALMLALEGHIRQRGGSVVLKTSVSGLAVRGDGTFEIATESAGGGDRAVLTARHLVLAAGLGASRLGDAIGGKPGYRPPRTYPARGHYYELDGKAPFRHLVYPMPREAWLGIHLTLDLTGRARFGPDLEWQAEPSYVFDEEDGARRRRFVDDIRRYWPGVTEDRLSPGSVGIRPKIYEQDQSAPDFQIHGESEHGHPRLVALYGIESPGLTSALAIGAHVAGLLSK